MKRKILILMIAALGLLAGCDSESSGGSGGTPTPPPDPVYYTCEIKFFSTLERNPEDEFTTREFEINKNIFVQVDFNFFNLDGVEDVIDYKANIKPGFDTYSVADYTKGPVEPTVPAHEEDFIDVDEKTKILEISGMKFAIKSEISKYHYIYVFTIKGQKADDSCYFKSIFQSQDGNFNRGISFSRQESFKFVEPQEPQEGDE